MGIVRKTWEECRKISEEQKQELAELVNKPDSYIDFSDIPELTEEFWQNAIPNPFYPHPKETVTVLIDSDVLAWLKEKAGRRYLMWLNGLLRKQMLQELQGKQRPV